MDCHITLETKRVYLSKAPVKNWQHYFITLLNGSNAKCVPSGKFKMAAPLNIWDDNVKLFRFIILLFGVLNQGVF